MKNINYWIAVISKDHIAKGVADGFIQVCHGKKSPLKRMKKDDWIIIYSGKKSMNGNEKCQAFTAIGQLTDDTIYSFQLSEEFIPFRRNVKFFPSNEVSIIPLISELDFIQNKKSWGYPFRFGLLKIGEKDFNYITSKMLNK